MAEEYENYESREAEARRAVERWEAEGGAQETEQAVEPTLDVKPGAEQTNLTGEPGEGTHNRGDSREG